LEAFGSKAAKEGRATSSVGGVTPIDSRETPLVTPGEHGLCVEGKAMSAQLDAPREVEIFSRHQIFRKAADVFEGAATDCQIAAPSCR
jgi:hypothetical protein